jgi:hypothetical protein
VVVPGSYEEKKREKRKKEKDNRPKGQLVNSFT